MSISPRRRAFSRKPMFLAACENRVFLHGPNSPKSCSRYSAVHIFKLPSFFLASNFSTKNHDPESILGPVQIQQGPEIASWPSKKHQKVALKNEAIFEAILDAKKHHFRI